MEFQQQLGETPRDSRVLAFFKASLKHSNNWKNRVITESRLIMRGGGAVAERRRVERKSMSTRETNKREDNTK